MIGSILPIHDHGLLAIAIERQIENRVVTRLRLQNAQHLPRIDRDRRRVFARAINHGRNFSRHAHTPRRILVSRLALLRFQDVHFCCSRHNLFLSFYKNNLLTEVSSWMD